MSLPLLKHDNQDPPRPTSVPVLGSSAARPADERLPKTQGGARENKPHPPAAPRLPLPVRSLSVSSVESGGWIGKDTLDYLLGRSDVSYRADKPVRAPEKDWDDDALRSILAIGKSSPRDSFLSAVLHTMSSDIGKGEVLPPSVIPREYWLYSEAPIPHAFSKDPSKVEYNASQGLWKKRIFPSEKPTGRIEVFLLARTMDQMLNDVDVSALSDPEQCYAADNDDFTDTFKRLFDVYTTGFGELIRQVYSTCAERGVLLDRIRKLYNDFSANCFDMITYLKKQVRMLMDRQKKAEEIVVNMKAELRSVKCEEMAKQTEIQLLQEEKEKLEAKIKDQSALEKRDQLLRRFVEHQSERNALLMQVEHAGKQRPDTTESAVTSVVGRSGAPENNDEDLPSECATESSEDEGGVADMEVQTVDEWDEPLYQRLVAFCDLITQSVHLTEAITPHYSRMVFGSPLKKATWAKDRFRRIVQENIIPVLRNSVGIGPAPDEVLKRAAPDQKNIPIFEGSFQVTKQMLAETLGDVNVTMKEIIARLNAIKVSRKTKQGRIATTDDQELSGDDSPDARGTGHRSPTTETANAPPGPHEDCTLCGRPGVAVVQKQDTDETAGPSSSQASTEGKATPGQEAGNLAKTFQKMYVAAKQETQRMADVVALRERDVNKLKRDIEKLKSFVQSGASEKDLSELSECGRLPDPEPAPPPRSPSPTPQHQLEMSPTTSMSPVPEMANYSVPTKTVSVQTEETVQRGGSFRKLSNGSASPPTTPHRLTSRGRAGSHINPDVPSPRCLSPPGSPQGSPSHTPREPSLNVGSPKQPGSPQHPQPPPLTIKLFFSRTEHTPAPPPAPGPEVRDVTRDTPISLNPNLPVTGMPTSPTYIPEKPDAPPGLFTSKSLHPLTAKRKGTLLPETTNRLSKRSQKDEARGKARRKREPIRNERLQFIVSNLKNFHPKSLTWLLKQISSMYRTKQQSDQTAGEIVSLPEHLFDHLRQKHGARKLVDDYAGSFLSTVQAHQSDPRVELFLLFITEQYSTDLLTLYLKYSKLLDEAKVGPEYSRGPDDQLEPAWVSLIRALFVVGQVETDPEYIGKLTEELEKVAEDCDRDVYRDGMLRTGYTPSAIPLVQEQWGCDESTARQRVRRIHVLRIVIQKASKRPEYVSTEVTSPLQTLLTTSPKSAFASASDST